MANPTQRGTKSKKGMRASHFALKKPITKKCEKCGESIMPHRACTNCGTYKGKTVLDTDKRIKRAQRSKGKK